MNRQADNKVITVSFCESFMERLVDHICENYAGHGADLSRLAVVFGGRRPALFCKRELSRRLKRDYFPPRFFTIDEFMQHIIERHEPFAAARDLDSCYLIYQLASKAMPDELEGRKSFAQFLPWAREIARFIDQLDLEDIEGKALSTIRANAEIGYDVPGNINELLKSIAGLRVDYHDALRRGGTYSRGRLYQRAAELVGGQDFPEFDQVLFCNFFYFHRTEEAVVKDLFRRDKATLIFQGDQRKWPVLERISQKFAVALREGEAPDTPAFQLNLHAGFDVHSQVGLVREVLKKIDSPEETVLVLPDPETLIVLMSEIHALVKDYNISMGYPIRRSSLTTLFEFLFKAQLSMKDGRYYTRDYLKALRHPFIKNLKLSADAAATRVLVHKIEEVLTGKVPTPISGSSFVRLDEVAGLEDIYLLSEPMLRRLGLNVTRRGLKALLEEIHVLLFSQWEGIARFADFAAALGSFLDTLVEHSFLKNYPLNLNIARRALEIKDEFANAAFAQETFGKDELFRIFEHKTVHDVVPFSGAPLKGLQVLGLQETRSLNFRNVIVLDANEGALPKLRIHEPLIPREVMIGLGLDRLELEEEVQRYQFMRLISSAKNVHLIYQENRNRERSRFVEELVWEEQKKRGAAIRVPATRPAFKVNVRPNKRRVHKTPQMIAFLKDRTYSASSVNMYLRDPMEFYTTYVLGLREQEDLLDEPEARRVGTFVHGLLEEAFTPYLNKAPRIDKAFRDRFAKIFERRFEETFARTMKADAFLLRSVLEERMNQFLENERSGEDRKVKKILHLESRFDDVIPLPAGDIKFRYVVDRVDELEDGTVMIVDYKTGGSDALPKEAGKLRDLELSRETLLEHIKSFQVPLYFHYLSRQFPDRRVNAALYNLKTLKLHKLIGPKTTLEPAEINEVFLNILNFCLSEILDVNIPFEAV